MADPNKRSDTPSADVIADFFIQTVCEFTGYPSDMLDHDLDLEGDLGIDEINRTRIFARMKDFLGDVSLEYGKLLSFKTLGEVLKYLQQYRSPFDLKVHPGTSKTLDLLLDPGSASAEDLSELLFEISKLYRLVGGRGIQFTVADSRSSVPAEDLQ